MNKKPYFLGACAAVVLAVAVACPRQATVDHTDNSYSALSAKAIEVHDEIMPQISQFDKTTVKIDSILNELGTMKSADPTLDTAQVRQELSSLKSDIESATDDMMDWMRNYNLDSTDVSYQEGEIKRITQMKEQFEEVRAEISTKMQPYK